MKLVYQAGIHLFKLGIWLASPFNPKARLLAKGQQQSFPYLKEKLENDRPVIWVHAASLGEFEQGRPLIEKIKQIYPAYRILLTFFSPSGYEIRKSYEGADYICYLPADTASNAKKFVAMVQPEMAFFIKYEFWFNYFSELRGKEIPLYLVSAIFRPEQLFFKKGIRANWYRNILGLVTHFFVQNQESAELLEKAGIKNITITGDTRFDRVAEIATNRKDLPLIAQFKNNATLIVAGSSWEPDEKLLVQFINQTPSVKIVFAPHEIKESNLRRLESMLNAHSVRYSNASMNGIAETQVLIIDSIGLLSSIYRYADIAYIGGGFGVGIHNTLEAAIYNIPVLFGPNYLKFQEAVNLVSRKIAFPVSSFIELKGSLTQLINDECQRKAIGEKCEQFMNENIGATQAIIRKVFNN